MPAPNPITGKPNLTPNQKRIAEAIVSIFETGSVHGDYGNVTVIKGDSGHLTYGRSQTTLASGNLYKLLLRYCGMEGATYGVRLKEYLGHVMSMDYNLDHDERFIRLLHLAGETDPLMKQAQDAFFDVVYWQPAYLRAGNLGLTLALSVAVVYDSTIHGSFPLISGKTSAKVGLPSAAGEKVWITAYCHIRREWLANHPNPVLHPTVYRMDAFLHMIENGNWSLSLPITANGITITRENLL